MTIDELTRIAREKIRQARRIKTVKACVGGMDVTLRGISIDEAEQARLFAREKHLQDAYIIYIACEELREVAKRLIELGEIKEETEAVFVWSKPDRDAVLQRILELSGLAGEPTAVFDEAIELKNL